MWAQAVGSILEPFARMPQLADQKMTVSIFAITNFTTPTCIAPHAESPAFLRLEVCRDSPIQAILR